MRITRHAYKRSRERIKLNHRATDRVARLAFDEGLRIPDVSGSLHRYLTKLYYAGDADEVRVFAEKIWIFKGIVLVTVYQLPNQYRHAANKLLAKKRQRIKEDRNEKGAAQNGSDPPSGPVPHPAPVLPARHQDPAEELAGAQVLQDGGVRREE